MLGWKCCTTGSVCACVLVCLQLSDNKCIDQHVEPLKRQGIPEEQCCVGGRETCGGNDEREVGGRWESKRWKWENWLYETREGCTKEDKERKKKKKIAQEMGFVEWTTWWKGTLKERTDNYKGSWHSQVRLNDDEHWQTPLTVTIWTEKVFKTAWDN